MRLIEDMGHTCVEVAQSSHLHSVYRIQNSAALSTLPSGYAGGLKQLHTGCTIDDDLKHRRATLHLGFMIGGDKSCGRGRTHIRQVKILGHAAKIPRVWVP